MKPYLFALVLFVGIIALSSSCAATVSFNGQQVKAKRTIDPTVKDRNLFHYSFVIGFAGVTHFHERKPGN